ncbi:MAG: trehalose-6-phosphate synthase, partial [Candidatus Margulisbacteria bacterium]|nr:trehalose-6-phosphate synthase [Candidatus Margulisiibacteriota bacterium]
MKKIINFASPLIIIVSLVIIIFGIIQVRLAEEATMDDLKRKAKTVAESVELSANFVLSKHDIAGAERLVKKFQNKKMIQGCALYGKDGKLIAITERFQDWKDEGKEYYKDILKNKQTRDRVGKYKKLYVYSHIIPVLDDKDRVLGMVEMIYDTSYVFARSMDLWRSVIITLVIIIASLLLITALTLRQMFMLPVQKLTTWFKQFQVGETSDMHGIKEKGVLGKLASEVEQIALSLRVARKTMSDAAAVRLKKDEIWTEGKLKDLVRAKLGSSSMVVVSNREPFMHVKEDQTGIVRCVKPASGVVTAIDPIMRACGGTWIALGSGNADRQFVNSKDKLGVPPEDIRYILKRVWLTPEEEDGFYYGFSNEGLWPLCHITYTRPVFRETDWQMYKKVNQKFADSIIEELPAKDAFVFIQDYHFTLLGKMIKEKRPDATVALFWHIPWPNPEVFSICPYQAEILDGMLGCDLIGFHVQYHCNNFLDTANRLLECRVDNEKNSIVRSGKETLVRPFPISIGGPFKAFLSAKETEENERIKNQYDLEGKRVAVGVDRIDYTKGIVERILAVDRFLEKYPEYRDKFVLIQLSSPSRTKIKSYINLSNEIEAQIEKVNSQYMSGNWKPIIYLKRYFTPEEILPYYRMGDICIVSSLHDGMNLVAKEYAASKSGAAGVLILSKFTGAARELHDALQINPYSLEEFCDTIKLACDMPPEEKKKRMENM